MRAPGRQPRGGAAERGADKCRLAPACVRGTCRLVCRTQVIVNSASEIGLLMSRWVHGPLDDLTQIWCARAHGSDEHVNGRRVHSFAVNRLTVLAMSGH